MTNENRHENVTVEVARAEQALEAAKALIGLALYADAVSRAYYAALHYLRAALFSRGIEPKTHGGAIHLFNLHLVRTGAFPATHNRLLGTMQRSRELADYDAAVVFTADEASAQVADAMAFRSEVVAFLVREGFAAKT